MLVTRTPSIRRPKRNTESDHTPSHIIPKSAYLRAVRFEYVLEGEGNKVIDCETDEEYDETSHVREEWRIEAWPEKKTDLTQAIPFEKVIFIQYERNHSSPDAQENYLLDTLQRNKYNDMAIILESMLRNDVLDSFSLVNSKPIFKRPYAINLPYDLPIIDYSSLSHVDDKALWIGLGMSKSPTRRLVTFNNEVCIYRVAEFPHDIPTITEELRKLILVKDSKWFANVIGKVRRQDNIEAFLLRYSSKGSLALYKGRREAAKKQLIVQTAKAYVEAESIGILSLPLNSNGIVLDDVDVGSIKVVDLGKAEFAEQRTNDPKLNTKLESTSRLVNDFGHFVLDFFNESLYYDNEDLEDWMDDTPEWVQRLVRRCCINGNFKSMSEVVKYLNE